MRSGSLAASKYGATYACPVSITFPRNPPRTPFDSPRPRTRSIVAPAFLAAVTTSPTNRSFPSFSLRARYASAARSQGTAVSPLAVNPTTADSSAFVRAATSASLPPTPTSRTYGPGAAPPCTMPHARSSQTFAHRNGRPVRVSLSSAAASLAVSSYAYTRSFTTGGRETRRTHSVVGTRNSTPNCTARSRRLYPVAWLGTCSNPQCTLRPLPATPETS